MTIRYTIEEKLADIIKKFEIENITPCVSYPPDSKQGDYTTNIAMILAKKIGKNPIILAEEIALTLKNSLKELNIVEKIHVVKPGFINITINKKHFVEQIDLMINEKEYIDVRNNNLYGKKIMVEYAHPNTHKEMHIGHMRTLVIGESIARILKTLGAEVFRANYQGDIGLHVAKAMIGIDELMNEDKLDFESVSQWTNEKKSHFLGRAYAKGNLLYDNGVLKDKIDNVNKFLYKNVFAKVQGQKDQENALPFASQEEERLWNRYLETRKWSLDYYADFYKRFYTKFDRLFFESEVADLGKKIVEENTGKVFEKQNGAVIFPGEKYGLHTRVFITNQANPTYEAKDMGLGFVEYGVFPFEQNIHVVASEQKGYFAVVIKALQLIDPEKFKGEHHLSMGMVQLKDRKMSSRTGDVLTVDWLLDELKKPIELMANEGRIATDKKEETINQIIIGAVKYSVLKVDVTQDVSFDIENSVSIEGNSGPYLQYTYARIQSILRKSNKTAVGSQITEKLEVEEYELLRKLSQFPEVVEDAGRRLSPHLLCAYLFEIGKAFNVFYQNCPVLTASGEEKIQRLFITFATGQIMKEGLRLLGIQTPEKM